MAHDADEERHDRRFWDVEDDYEKLPIHRRRAYRIHSGLGIASFIPALVGVGLFSLMLLLVAVSQVNERRYRRNESLATLALLLFCGAGLTALVGVGLGIGGMYQPERRKVFATIGLSLNIVLLLIVLGLILAAVLAVWASRH